MPDLKIAVFISPHGFGHAARAAAVCQALLEIEPSLHFEIFTTVPVWFFAETLGSPKAFSHHAMAVDLGMVQQGPFAENVVATIERLNDFLPFADDWIAELVQLVQQQKCQLVICDIAPLGIQVAKQAGLPSVLIENFTWDWIYQGYLDQDQRFQPHIDYLAALFQAATWHIQTEPICLPGHADLLTAPISRTPRQSRAATRQELGVGLEEALVLISMGGIALEYGFLPRLQKEYPSMRFVVFCARDTAVWQDNVLLLPYHSAFYHPDLVHACDAIIGKVGYSTVAEIYYAGTPFGVVTRPHFRESSVLTKYIRTHFPSIQWSVRQFETGAWLRQLPELLTLPKEERRYVLNGSRQAAEFIYRLLLGA